MLRPFQRTDVLELSTWKKEANQMKRTLENADWLEFLAECDCTPDGEEWLDRHEPKKYVNIKKGKK
jgi:hypothetical protein